MQISKSVFSVSALNAGFGLDWAKTTITLFIAVNIKGDGGAMLLTTQRMNPPPSSIIKMFTGCGDKQRFKASLVTKVLIKNPFIWNARIRRMGITYGPLHHWVVRWLAAGGPLPSVCLSKLTTLSFLGLCWSGVTDNNDSMDSSISVQSKRADIACSFWDLFEIRIVFIQEKKFI